MICDIRGNYHFYIIILTFFEKHNIWVKLYFDTHIFPLINTVPPCDLNIAEGHIVISIKFWSIMQPTAVMLLV